MFVTVDGLDGSGKTTVVSALADKARREGCDVFVAAFPGTSDLGRCVRKFLLDPERKRDFITETLLLLGNFREVYLRYLESTGTLLLIADRFITSTIGYQGAMSDHARQTVRKAIDLAFPKPVIDVRLILDVPWEVGQARVANRSGADRFDLVDREAFNRIRNEIMVSSTRDRPSACVLDNSGDFADTISSAWEVISAHAAFGKTRSC